MTGGEVGDGLESRRRGVRDEEVVRRAVGEERIDVVGRLELEGHRAGRAARTGDLVDDLFGGLPLAPVGERHRDAVGGQESADARAHAPGAACHERRRCGGVEHAAALARGA